MSAISDIENKKYRESQERKVFISFLELCAFLEEQQRSRLDYFLGRLLLQTFFLTSHLRDLCEETFKCLYVGLFSFAAVYFVSVT